jgi:DNA adenine methylase
MDVNGKSKKTRPFFRYPGSKNRLANWILGSIPKKADSYIVCFGGSAPTLFARPRSGIEVYNDLSGDLVHLFRVIRDTPEPLIQAIHFTLWSPEELALAYQPTPYPIERARRMYVRLWMARYPFDERPSFRRQKIFSRGSDGKSSMKPASNLFAEVDHLFEICDRLRGVTIENMDAIELVRRYDNNRAAFYLDPPYPSETRQRVSHYGLEIDTDYHIKLATALYELSGFVVLSGYQCPLYAELYETGGWLRVDKETRVDGANSKVESLWINPAAQEQLEKESADSFIGLPLLGGLNNV